MFILYLNVFINSDLIENCLDENSYDAGSDVMGLGGVLTDELRTGTGVQTVPGVDGPDVQTASLGPQHSACRMFAKLLKTLKRGGVLLVLLHCCLTR